MTMNRTAAELYRQAEDTLRDLRASMKGITVSDHQASTSATATENGGGNIEVLIDLPPGIEIGGGNAVRIPVDPRAANRLAKDIIDAMTRLGHTTWMSAAISDEEPEATACNCAHCGGDPGGWGHPDHDPTNTQTRTYWTSAKDEVEAMNRIGRDKPLCSNAASAHYYVENGEALYRITIERFPLDEKTVVQTYLDTIDRS